MALFRSHHLQFKAKGGGAVRGGAGRCGARSCALYFYSKADSGTQHWDGVRLQGWGALKDLSNPIRQLHGSMIFKDPLNTTIMWFCNL